MDVRFGGKVGGRQQWKRENRVEAVVMRVYYINV